MTLESRAARLDDPTVPSARVLFRKAEERRALLKATALGVAAAVATASGVVGAWTFLIDRRAPASVTASPPVAPTPPAPVVEEPKEPDVAPTEVASAATPERAPPVAAPAPPRAGAMGALTVVCIPKCESIVDNGVQVGPGHVFNRPVPAGTHHLRLSTASGAVKTLDVVVLPDQTREVRVAVEIPPTRD